MPSEYAGERLRSVRQLMGISQVELASATGFSQSLLSQVENGARDASEEMLDAVARATETPRSFFEAMPPDIPLGTLRFRKNSQARQTDTKRTKALFDEAHRITVQLLEDVDYPKPDLPVVLNDPTPDDLEDLAVAVRESLQLTDEGPIRHLSRSCERIGIAVVPLTLPNVGEVEEDAVGHFGLSFWPGKDDHALIGYFTGGGGDRQRFTLAHELGHLTLHSRRRNVRDAEREANYFASALLVPRHRAEEMFAEDVTLSDLQRMKVRWGVSIQALIMRGAHLGLIDEKRKTSLFKQLSSRGWRKNEPGVVHAEEPLLLWTLLSRIYGSEGLSASQSLGLGSVILRSIAPRPSTTSATKEEAPDRGALTIQGEGLRVADQKVKRLDHWR